MPRFAHAAHSLAFASALLAPPPAQAGHPFATDDAGTVGRSALELEVNAAALRWTAPRAVSQMGFGAAVHFGLAPTFDVGVGFTYVLDDEEGQWAAAMQDPALDLKWRLVEPDSGVPGLALRLDYEAPQRLAAGSTGHDLGGVLIASWELERLALHLDAGMYAHGMSRAGHTHLTGYAAAAVIGEVLQGLSLGVEGSADGVPNDVHGASVLGGLVMEPAPGYAVSFGTGLLWEQPHVLGWMGTVGLTVGVGGSRS